MLRYFAATIVYLFSSALMMLFSHKASPIHHRYSSGNKRDTPSVSRIDFGATVREDDSRDRHAIPMAQPSVSSFIT